MEKRASLIHVKDRSALNVVLHDQVMVMSEINDIEYRGYTLIAVEQSPGWRVHIYPRQGVLHTNPDTVSGLTKAEAFAKARATVDYHLLG